MTDAQAAKRIWTDGHDYWAHPTHKDDKTEYIRADLVEALEAENQRLREALREIEELNLTTMDENGHRWESSDLIGQEIRAALRSTEANHDD